jgi:hypothetical protein
MRIFLVKLWVEVVWFNWKPSMSQALNGAPSLTEAEFNNCAQE